MKWGHCPSLENLRNRVVSLLCNYAVDCTLNSATACMRSCTVVHCRDVHKTISHKTKMRPRRSTFKTKTFYFSNSRPGRDRDVEPSRPRRDQDVPFSQTLKTETRRSTFKTETKTFQKTSRDCSLKTVTGEVCRLTTCFLQIRSIIFFPIYLQA